MFLNRATGRHVEWPEFSLHASKNPPRGTSSQTGKESASAVPTKRQRAACCRRLACLPWLLAVSTAILIAATPTGLFSQPRPAQVMGTWRGVKATGGLPWLEIGPCTDALTGRVVLQITGETASGSLTGLLHFGDLSSPLSGWAAGTRVRVAAVYVIHAPNRLVMPTGSVQENLVVTLKGAVDGDMLGGLVTQRIPACSDRTVLEVPVSLERITAGTKTHREKPNPRVLPPPYTITSSSECTGPGTATVSNGTHGSIRVLSGTGAFASLSAGCRTISVAPGAPINGTVRLSVVNQGPGFAVAPLIWTPSWGDPASSWRLIQGWVGDGQSVFSATLRLTSPQVPGTYHIVFAFQLETNGASVASATNWAGGEPVWGDGNDIADFNRQQIAEAQQYGCTTDNWLSQTGYHPIFVPTDAIKILVRTTSVSPTPARKTIVDVPANVPWKPTGIRLQRGNAIAISATGPIQTNFAGATATSGGTGRSCSVAGHVYDPFVAPELPCWSLLGRREGLTMPTLVATLEAIRAAVFFAELVDLPAR